MNLNHAAKWVAAHEGGKQNLSIAQVKEVIKWFLLYAAHHSDLEGVAKAIMRMERRHG